MTNPTTGGAFEQTTLPFGTPLNAESSGATNQRFTSYDRSAVTGLDYAVNRHYDAGQNRFTQVDPIRMAAANLANPQSLNLYAYVENDPVNLVDPLGLNASSPGTTYSSGILWTLWYGNNKDGWTALFSWFEPYPGSNQTNIGGAFSSERQKQVDDLKNRVGKLLKDPKCAKVLGGVKNAAALLARANVRNANTINPKYKGTGGLARNTAAQARRLAEDPKSNNLAFSERGVGTTPDGKKVYPTNIYLNERFFTFNEKDSDFKSEQETVFIHELNRLNGYSGNPKNDYDRITKACGTTDPYNRK